MTVGHALFAAIRADPADDDLRLVYADWLLDRGDLRGELIQLQCGSGRDQPEARQRALDLIRRHARNWLGSIADGLDDQAWSFHRGFLHSIRFPTVEKALAAIPALLAMGPMPLIDTDDGALVTVSPDATRAAVRLLTVEWGPGGMRFGSARFDVHDFATRQRVMAPIERDWEEREDQESGVVRGGPPAARWYDDGRLAIYDSGTHEILDTISASGPPTRLHPPYLTDLLGALRTAGTDWSDGLVDLLAVPGPLRRRDNHTARYFVSRPGFAIEWLTHPSITTIRALPDDYGVALFGTGTKVSFLLADMRRAIVVREILLAFHGAQPERSWRPVRRSIPLALRHAASVAAGRVIVWDDGHVRIVPRADP